MSDITPRPVARVQRTGLALLALLVGVGPATLREANAFGFEVVVTIESITAQVSFDSTSESDFYARVTIDGHEKHNYGTPGQLALEGMDSIDTSLLNTGSSDWQFRRLVDPQKLTIPIVVTIYDEDDFLNGGDDLADIDPESGAVSLNLDVDLKTCAITGEQTGTCGAVITSSGNGDADGNATVGVRVEVPGFNASGGLHVHCLHSPIWPQPGDTVTITAIALGDNLKPRLVDEISFTRETSSTEQTETNVALSLLDVSLMPDDEEFSYSCTIADDADSSGTLEPEEVAFSGYRTVQVGVPETGRAVPILLSGFVESRHDVVLIPDAGYTDAANADFLSDAHGVIGLYYLSGLPFIDGQDNVSFWIAQDTGVAVGFNENTDTCDRAPPSNWSTEYAAFANAAVILHRKDIRDCSTGGVATAHTVSFPQGGGVTPFQPVLGFTPFVHELGHALYSLADEYCYTRPGANPNSVCDGGYFQVSPFPNVFDDLQDCLDDKAMDPDGGSKTCQSFVSESKTSMGETFYTFDPSADDLMVDRQLPQYLDTRRIEHVITDCEGC